MDLATLAAIAAIVALPTTLLLWMMSKIHNDMTAQIARLDATNLKIDANTIAMNARIDTTQGIIMKMLEKQGK